MSRYRVAHSYRSSYYALEVGQVIDLDEETAAFLNRDSPGVLVPVAAVRDVEKPEATRQVTAPTGRRTRASSGG